MQIGIIGGGLAGLVSGCLLAKAGHKVLLVEQKKYPFHRVCGEYISNEVKDFLVRHDLFPTALDYSNITQFKLTSIAGRVLEMPLDLGGFGISRYKLDFFLVEKLKSLGGEIRHDRVIGCGLSQDKMRMQLKSDEELHFDFVLGAFGKRSALDKELKRSFLRKKSPYIGVKYHIETDLIANNIVELHNFQGGYCGVNKVEEDRFNLCYLANRSSMNSCKNIGEMEENVLFRNPHLRRIFEGSEFIFKKPEVIHEITFEEKEPVHNHILMIGDAAGMITPLCGNGMAIAINAARMAADLLIKSEGMGDRSSVERQYEKNWKQAFSGRLSAGRTIQKLFGGRLASEFAVTLGNTFRPVAGYLMKQTHGTPF
ncbi:MAG: NAD(P)/FAD-dependent oxidoreductase [Bacteroidota bacterium]